MRAVVQDESMTKPKGRPKKPSGEGTPVRIATDLVSMARYIAASRGTTMTELISAWLRPIIEREFQKLSKEIRPGGS
jgi:hypothetical protein